jgi:hypothetical protein
MAKGRPEGDIHPLRFDIPSPEWQVKGAQNPYATFFIALHPEPLLATQLQPGPGAYPQFD